jgi:hypothetical protein
MSDEQIWNLISYVVTVVGTAMFVTWWFKSQLVGGQIAGLKAENDNLRAQIGNINASREVLEQRRLLAEEQRKKAADDLSDVSAKLQTAMAQINQHASAQALSATIEVARISTSSAIAANTATGTFLKPDKGVELFVAGTSDELRKRSNLDLTKGSGDLNWHGGNKQGEPK